MASASDGKWQSRAWRFRASMSPECVKNYETFPENVVAVTQRIISTQREGSSKIHVHLLAGWDADRCIEIRPHRRCSMRDHPDGIDKLQLQVYLGGIFLPKPPVSVGRDLGLQKTPSCKVLFGLVHACARPGLATQKWKNAGCLHLWTSIFGFEIFFFHASCRGAGEAILRFRDSSPLGVLLRRCT